jgi:hypothetical protein
MLSVYPNRLRSYDLLWPAILDIHRVFIVTLTRNFWNNSLFPPDFQDPIKASVAWSIISNPLAMRMGNRAHTNYADCRADDLPGHRQLILNEPWPKIAITISAVLSKKSILRIKTEYIGYVEVNFHFEVAIYILLS